MVLTQNKDSALYHNHIGPYTGPFKPFSDVWWFKGTLSGGSMTRNMVLFKDTLGDLFIFSAVAVSEKHLEEICAWGKPTYLIIPNSLHRLDGPAFLDRFPDLKVIAPSGGKERILQKIRIDYLMEEFNHSEVSFLQVPGFRLSEAVMKIKLSDGGGLLVFTDLLFNLPNGGGFSGWILKTLGSSGFFGVTRLGRWAFTRDRFALREFLKDLCKQTEMKGIMVAHGEPILEQPGQQLLKAADFL